MEAATNTTNDANAKETSLNLAIARLSGVDDISDIDIDDVADELHKTIAAKPVYDKYKSVFDTTLELTPSRPACEQLDIDVDAYKQQVIQEKQYWEYFLRKNTLRPGALRTTSASYKPDQDQQAYLNGGPNLQTFIRGLKQFMNVGNSFLMEDQKLQDLQEDLKDCCQFHVHRMQRNNIADYLTRK